MKYSELLRNLIGKEAGMDLYDTVFFFNINDKTEERMCKIVDVGDDFVIIESSKKNQGSRTTIPLNLFITRGVY